MHIKISIISKFFITSLFIISSLVFSSVTSAQAVQFNNNLYWNVQPAPHPEVKILQQFLKDQGLYSSDITGNYLIDTYKAVVAFQKKYKIKPSDGYFGPMSRAKANEILSGAQSQATTNNTSPSLISSPTPTENLVAYSGTTLTTQTTQVSQSNLIKNPSVETANGTKPLNWNNGKWGTNTATFTYPTAGQDGTKAVGINMTAYTSGDAKWYFDDVTVTPGTTYTFTEYYKSNVVTNVTVRWTSSTGAVSYQSLGNPVASTNWTQRTNTITVPAGVTKMTIFHLIKNVGTLDIDNFSLISGITTTSVPSPIDAVVSIWTSWTPVSQWSVCTNNSQSRTEERNRTVLSPASNGGNTPTLRELRTVTQSCITIPVSTNSTTPATSTTNTTSSYNVNFPIKEWGVYTGWQETSLDSFESLVDNQAKYRAVFVHWGNENAFPVYLSRYVKDRNKTLVIFWEATNYNITSANQVEYSYDRINNGSWDGYISQFSAAAKAYGGEVIIIPFSEMNGNWFPWSITQNGNNPEKHISAYRRLRDFFREVPNVKFGWAPNHDSVPDTSINKFENFYPGDEYVDYVGLDGFNFGSPWMTFDQIFADPLKRIKIYNKPIFIFSFASAQGTQKANWINDAINVQIPKYPEIKAWIWFNENKEKDWRVNSDMNSLNTFKLAIPPAI